MWLIAIGIWMAVGATFVHADEPGDVRGGYFEYSWSQGKFRWEPFLKVRHPQDGAMDDEGRAFIWGYRTWNLEPPKEDGKTYAVNILEEYWIPCDNKTHKITIHHPNEPDRVVERQVKCPDTLWNGQTQMASQ